MAPPQHKIDATLQAMEKAHRATADEQVQNFSRTINVARRDFEKFATAEENASRQNESAGGTSFYTFGGKTFYSDPTVTHTYDVEGTMPVTKYINDSIHDWEMIGMVPMQFNRMILYNQAILHSAYVKEGMFVGDNYRLNQQFFI